jgi:hypothetical protein
MLLAVSVLVGVAFILGSPPPGSLATSLPGWEIHAWAIAMLGSGVVGLFGQSVRRDVGLSLRLEMGAMLVGSGALLLYTTAVFAVGGWRGLVAGGITAAWTAANVWRVAQIRADLKGL